MFKSITKGFTNKSSPYRPKRNKPLIIMSSAPRSLDSHNNQGKRIVAAAADRSVASLPSPIAPLKIAILQVSLDHFLNTHHFAMQE